MLWHTDPRRGRTVVAASAAAVRRGVRPAMPLVEARTLLQSSGATPMPGATPMRGATERRGDTGPVIAAHDPAADLTALRDLAETLSLEISPLVALEPLEKARWAGQHLHQPEALLLDVTGLGRWFGDEAQLLHQATTVLRRHGLSARLALCSSVGAAWAFAHYGPESSAMRHGSCRVWQVPAAETQAALATLPVACLRLPVPAAEKLHRLGIATVDELLQLPRSGLTSRLGPQVLTRIDQALGTVDQTLPVHHAAPEDVATTDLEYPTNATDLLKHRLQGLVERLAQQLSRRQHGVLRLACRLDLVQAPSRHLRVGLFAPTADAAHLTGLLHNVFEQQRLPSAVHRIVLAAPLTGPLQAIQQSLLGETGAGAADQKRFAQLIDNLSNRLGADRVLGLRPSKDPLPERAYKTVPLTGRLQSRNRRRGSRAVGGESNTSRRRKAPRDGKRAGDNGVYRSALDVPLRRPLDLLSQPEPIEAVELHVEGWPQQIRLPRWPAAQRTVRAWGPERIETGWWQGPSIRRDYYRIEIETGPWLWIYRQLGTDRWWLHGWFG